VEFASIANMALNGIGTMQNVALNTLAQEIDAENSIWDRERKRRLDEIREYEEFLNVRQGVDVSKVLTEGWKVNNNINGLDAETLINASINNRFEMPYSMFSYDRIDVNTAIYI
tara:strand:+ start:76 stop:417 length:342 start_codon:yes stop_codon:yes gene_type:complete